MRTTTGMERSPRVRLRIFARLLTICSKAGYPKASNCISITGRNPYIAMPIAAPIIPASEMGVSKQRSSPNRSVSPSVTRKTPPRVPTSTPNITTRSLCCISWPKARLRAPTIEVRCTASERDWVDSGA